MVDCAARFDWHGVGGWIDLVRSVLFKLGEIEDREDESLQPMDWKSELEEEEEIERNKESWEEEEDEESERKKKRLSEGTRIPLKVCHLSNAVTANSILGTNVRSGSELQVLKLLMGQMSGTVCIFSPSI
ncbi:uncharacterized protein LOC133723476 [Rosa rugosa]|uniref:uncharacterized protein LOC133723476 n=1 Tax=Rosa rugosa TaxID=74645 RepID=UPI002B408AE4|nr:uncharacterized protein LOC133723476 [Rosa rugosa]